jgi:hypothetical protein
MGRLAVALALVALPLAARAGLTFPVPAGWLDLSPGAPEENFRGVPEDFARTLRSGQFKAFAFDVAHTERGFTPNLNAVAIDPPIRISGENQEEVARALFGPIEKGMPGAVLVEKGLVEVDGVKALRIVYDSSASGAPLRQMAVLVPGVPNSAVVTYSALRDRFEALRPAFDAHLAAIRGAQEPEGARHERLGAVVGAVAGGLVAAAAAVWMRRRRAA